MVATTKTVAPTQTNELLNLTAHCKAYIIHSVTKQTDLIVNCKWKYKLKPNCAYRDIYMYMYIQFSSICLHKFYSLLYSNVDVFGSL